MPRMLTARHLAGNGASAESDFRHVGSMTSGCCRQRRGRPDLNDHRMDAAMTRPNPPSPMPMRYLLGLLLGLPLGSTLLSLLLLARPVVLAHGLDFQSLFWILVTLWYAAQLLLLRCVLRASGWHWRDLGYGFGRRGSVALIGGYLLFALCLVATVEFALRLTGAVDPAKLSDLANLAPQSTASRMVFICMALLGGLCEELVYRGFALQALRSRGLGAWVSSGVATLAFVFQHGLKSIDQFWWFFLWGLALCLQFIVSGRLWPNIVVHWLLILSAVLAVLPHSS
ncbi:CPBP family intramembrane metalloprotease [Xanthomonas campestris pv. phormiicola]|nr:CPBP family intramembrane metalloprotease [Xanthomonas campestris pv. phormiicola]UYC16445.1 CPBP family intramembrane metalloprotease [Xanthomonas campestris pv. phormiicola]